jgi:hypothetical protein
VKLFLAAVAVTASLARAETSDVDIRHTVSAGTGLMNYTQAGASPKSGSNTSNFALEWGYFAKKDFQAYAGYRLARDAEKQRVLYQAGGAGARFFPMTLGAPLASYRQLAVLRYDFAFKPYVEGGMSFGRYLVDTVFTLEAADYSSEFFGVSFGGGTVYGLTQRLALDFKVLVEIEQGYGPLAFQGTTQFVTLGLLQYI